MWILVTALVAFGFPTDNDSWEMYWSFYKEDDDPPTMVTLSNLTLP